VEQHFRAPCPRDHASWPRIDFEQKIAGAPCNLDLVSVLIKNLSLNFEEEKILRSVFKTISRDTPVFHIL